MLFLLCSYVHVHVCVCSTMPTFFFLYFLSFYANFDLFFVEFLNFFFYWKNCDIKREILFIFLFLISYFLFFFSIFMLIYNNYKAIIPFLFLINYFCFNLKNKGTAKLKQKRTNFFVFNVLKSDLFKKKEKFNTNSVPFKLFI